MVGAVAPVVTTVIRPLPLIQYCHSAALGCQCISRMAPGLMVTMAAAMLLEIGKFVESTTRASPPGKLTVGCMAAILNVYRFLVSRCSPRKRLSSASDAGSVASKMYSCFFGSLSIDSRDQPVFFFPISGDGRPGHCETR